MRRLRSDTWNLTRGGTASPRRIEVRPLFVILVLTSLGLLLLSRLNHSALAEARWKIAASMAPIMQAAMIPLEPIRRVQRQLAAQVDSTAEIERLKTENQKLSNWEWRGRELERRLSALEALAKTVPVMSMNFVTSRVIADSSGAFVRSVMIDAGREETVKSGYPAIDGDGLVGRVVETGKHTSRILLATDLNSRIPVTVGDGMVRAILAGDNGPEPRLIYQPQDSKISVGDVVATSGAGGMFPRGLRIGEVTGDPVAPRVRLKANLDNLEYISVLLYDDPSHDLLGDSVMREPHRIASEPLPGSGKELRR